MEKNIKDLIIKCINENLSDQDREDINLFFQKDEVEFIKVFNRNFNNYQYNAINNLLKNISSLSYDCYYILKYKCFISIFSYYFNQSNKEDLFKIIKEREDLHNSIYFYMRGYHTKDIISFIQQLCEYCSFEFKEEMLSCLSKIEINEKLKILNSISDSEKYYYHLQSVKRNSSYSSLFDMIDNYFIQRDKSYYKYLSSTICDDSDFCLYFLNLDYVQIKSSKLIYLLINNFNSCIKTLNQILDKAVKEKDSDMIIKLSPVFSKKETLNRLIQIGDNAYIKPYLDTNKNSKEIKDLVIYY